MSDRIGYSLQLPHPLRRQLGCQVSPGRPKNPMPVAVEHVPDRAISLKHLRNLVKVIRIVCVNDDRLVTVFIATAVTHHDMARPFNQADGNIASLKFHIESKIKESHPA